MAAFDRAEQCSVFVDDQPSAVDMDIDIDVRRPVRALGLGLEKESIRVEPVAQAVQIARGATRMPWFCARYMICGTNDVCARMH